MAFKGWIKKYEHQYHEVPVSDELNAPEDVTENVTAASSLGDAEHVHADAAVDAETHDDEGEAAGVSSRGRVVSRMISYIARAF